MFKIILYIILFPFILVGFALWVFFKSIAVLINLIVNVLSGNKNNKISSYNMLENNESYAVSTVEELKTRYAGGSVTPIISLSQDYSNYKLPDISILDAIKKNDKANTDEQYQINYKLLEELLNEFKIIGKITNHNEGPAITQYELEIKVGTKVESILKLKKEISFALGVDELKIIPLPEKGIIGIEVPNKKRNIISMKEVLTSFPKSSHAFKILVPLGKDTIGKSVCVDLTSFPHLLIAGSTGSGKSVCVNNFIASILMFQRPDEVKLVMVDPKKVELSIYNGVPHLLEPVITNPKKASMALQKVVSEMERRFELLEEKAVKNISAYNGLIGKTSGGKLPYIVVIIDGFTDVMLSEPVEIEDLVVRIKQLGKAAGIHLIIATNRPSKDIITGTIRANIESRICFSVPSTNDSNVVINQPGAEKLLGEGDMLFLSAGKSEPKRIQGCYISDEELTRIIKYVSKEKVAEYEKSILTAEPTNMTGENLEKMEYDDPLYDEILNFAVQTGKVSASLIQRRFRLGYNRTLRIIDLLDERGVVGPQSGSKPREVLIKIVNK